MKVHRLWIDDMTESHEVESMVTQAQQTTLVEGRKSNGRKETCQNDMTQIVVVLLDASLPFGWET